MIVAAELKNEGAGGSEGFEAAALNAAFKKAAALESTVGGEIGETKAVHRFALFATPCAKKLRIEVG